MAAGVPGAAVSERVVNAPLDQVWEILTDFENGFTTVQPDMHRVRVLTRAGDRVELHARGRLGQRAHLRGIVRPGWCWLQSRFLIIGMAAAAQPDGRTRVALTGGVRVPTMAAVVPVGVRRESRRSLERLEGLVARSDG
ncbi:hypothetical protein [Actinomadura sp. 7K507]|uniref:hypothetical protein n=1 Tax=Actinomadura sp. 7K507 TaxID=2530365 RepID=UPI001A9F0754|nr:hypothetical protein [Actinomadura sp. 7K507]